MIGHMRRSLGLLCVTQGTAESELESICLFGEWGVEDEGWEDTGSQAAQDALMSIIAMASFGLSGSEDRRIRSPKPAVTI